MTKRGAIWITKNGKALWLVLGGHEVARGARRWWREYRYVLGIPALFAVGGGMLWLAEVYPYVALGLGCGVVVGVGAWVCWVAGRKERGGNERQE